MSDWQPISTAPKDEGLILLFPSRCWCAEEDRGEVGYWCDGIQDWVAFGPTAEDYYGPTHWMPLPEPPK